MSIEAVIRVFDCETAGMEPPAGLVEVATVDLIVYADGRVVRGRMWSSFVNPGAPIPPEASGVHDITDDMVKDAPGFGDVVEEIATGAAAGEPEPTHYAAHNAKFDRQWFNPPGSVWIDTYRVAQVLWPDAPNHKLGTLFYYLNIKLADEAGPRHRALADAYITAAILRRSLRSGTIEEMVDVTENPIMLKRIYFGKHATSEFKDLPEDYLTWMVKQTNMDPDAVYTAFHELQRRRDAANQEAKHGDEGVAAGPDQGVRG